MQKELLDFRKKLRSAPDEVETLWDLASTYMESARYADAVVVLQQLLGRRPTDVNAMLACGTCYRKLDLLEPAASEFERATRADPENALARSNLGRIYDLMGRNEDAITQHMTAIGLDPDGS